MIKNISTFLENKNSRFLQGLGILVILILIAIPVIVMATVPAPTPPAGAGIGPERLLTDIIVLFRNILFLLGVLMIIYGAFNFVTAAGDDKKIESGRNVILYALVAVAVAALAHLLVDWVRHWAPRQ